MHAILINPDHRSVTTWDLPADAGLQAPSIKLALRCRATAELGPLGTGDLVHIDRFALGRSSDLFVSSLFGRPVQGPALIVGQRDSTGGHQSACLTADLVRRDVCFVSAADMHAHVARFVASDSTMDVDDDASRSAAVVRPFEIGCRVRATPTSAAAGDVGCGRPGPIQSREGGPR